MVTVDLVLVVLALVAFILAAGGVAVPRLNLVALGLAFWMLAQLI